MNQLDYEYRFKFNKTYLKLSKYERLLNAKVYKELVIDNNCYLIINAVIVVSNDATEIQNDGV